MRVFELQWEIEKFFWTREILLFEDRNTFSAKNCENKGEIVRLEQFLLFFYGIFKKNRISKFFGIEEDFLEKQKSL